ncbi:MAG: putative Ig domain-containing protein [Trebonia sp.]
MRIRRLLRSGLALLALGLGAASWPGPVTATAHAIPAPGSHLPGGPCRAFPGARQLPGADGIVPAAWSGGGLVVPACGPAPGDGTTAAAVYPYPDALWTAGYQCVEFSERYLYDRYGVMMDIATDGDQVVAHYAAGYPGLFMVIRNGTPHRAPAAGDVLSLSAAPGFDSANGGHTAVVQSSAVSAAGNGTVTVVEENADAAGVAVLQVSDWIVRYPGFAFVEWLATAGLTVTSPHPPRAVAGTRYSFALTATDGKPPYRWRVTSGALPAGLALSPAGVLSGTARAGAAAVTPTGGWPVDVAVTDARGATATAGLSLSVTGALATPAGNLRHAEWAWHDQYNEEW